MMQRMKRAVAVCVLLGIGAALAGCVVVPVPYGYYGGYYGGYHHYHR